MKMNTFNKQNTIFSLTLKIFGILVIFSLNSYGTNEIGTCFASD